MMAHQINTGFGQRTEDIPACQIVEGVTIPSIFKIEQIDRAPTELIIGRCRISMRQGEKRAWMGKCRSNTSARLLKSCRRSIRQCTAPVLDFMTVFEPSLGFLKAR